MESCLGIGKQVLTKGDLITCTVFKRPALGSAVWPGMAFLYLALCNSAITHEFLGSFFVTSLFIVNLFTLCIYAYTCMCTLTCMSGSGDIRIVGCLLPPCGPCRSNSDFQAWKQEPPLVEPPRWTHTAANV